MHPSMKAEFAARDGDLRLYLLLGLAAWFLFLDHVPHNAVSLLTMRNFGLVAQSIFSCLSAAIRLQFSTEE